VNYPSQAAIDRLRPADAERVERVRPQDAEISVRPKFWQLALYALCAIVLQSTLLHPLTLRGAHLSLVTILVVWSGLRCGITMGGIVGFLAGLVEDGLGGAGVNVLGTTLIGFAAGLLNPRFFADSLPVFVSAVAGATVLRGIVTYFAMEIGLRERGMFHSYSHEIFWQVVLNATAAALTLLAMRVIAHARS
jgi:rod shape-determining protein MreD